MASLFYATSKHVSKSAGSESLHPVMDLNTSERFKPLCIVKRKKSFWFWKKPKMIPTQITLHDVLLQKIQLPSSAKTFTIMEKFVEKPTFKLDGKIGAAIASELNLKVSGTDSVSISMELGDIIKTQVNWQVLNEFLQNNPINVAHQLLTNAGNSTHTTLCVVLESLATKGDGSLMESDDIKVQTDDTLPLQKSMVKVDIQVQGSVEKETAHSFTIPSNTVLAYSCNEFSIDKNGVATLHSAIDRLDESNEPLFVEKPNVTDPVIIVKNELAPLMKAENFERFRNEIKLLLENVTEETLQAMHLLVSSAVLNAEQNDDNRSMSIAVLENLFEGESNAVLKNLLLTIGFMIPEDLTNENALVEFPADDYRHLLKPCLGVIDALSDISSSARGLLSNISTTHAKVLLNIVQKQFYGEDCSKRDSTISKMFISDPSTEMFLKNIGFIEMQADDDELICHTGGTKSSLMDVFTILYVISSQSE